MTTALVCESWLIFYPSWMIVEDNYQNYSESLIKKDQEKRDAERKDYNNRMLEAAEKTSSNTGSLNKLEKFFDKFRLLGIQEVVIWKK